MVHLRRAGVADAASLAAVHVAGWRWAYRGQIPDAFLDGLSVETRAASWRTSLAAADGPRVWIASQGERDVGFIATNDRAQDDGLPPLTAYLGAIYLYEDATRTGIGGALLDEAMRDLAARGFRRAYLWCLRGNTGARAFYEKHGWRHDGVVKIEDRGTFTLDDLRYVRDVESKVLPIPEIRTDRLLLRPWRDADLAPFAEMNADPEVMAFFPSTLTRAESDGLVARLRRQFEDVGFAFWAVEVPGVAPFIGFVGLVYPHLPPPFAPGVEVGWRLARAHWNRGYATEGARAALAAGFERLGLPEIVSLTTTANARSRHVMEKLGMHTVPEDDFDHPRIPEESPMRRCVLYRITRDEWSAYVSR